RYHGLGPLEGMDLLAGGWVIDRDSIYLADGEEPAVRAERDTGWPLGAGNRTPFGQRVFPPTPSPSPPGRGDKGQVPQLDSFSPTGGRKGSAVGRKGHGNYIAAVSAQGVTGRMSQIKSPLLIHPSAFILHPSGFPEFHGAVPAGGGEPAAVGAEGHPGDHILVCREGDTV